MHIYKLDRWWSLLGASLSCCGVVRHAKREGGVYAHPYVFRACKSCLCMYCAYVEKGLCKVTSEKNWRTWKPRMATLTRKHKYEELHWSLSHSSLCFSFPHHRCSLGLVAITTLTHCTVHMAWRGMVWKPWRGSIGTCNVLVSCEWYGHGRLVGWSVDACVPVDHISVGLTQARPNYGYLERYDQCRSYSYICHIWSVWGTSHSGELRTGTRVGRAKFIQSLEWYIYIYQCSKLLEEWKCFGISPW